MGLLISVYKNSEFGDCTNGGVSSKTNKLCVVNVEGPFEPSEDAPAVKLLSGPYDTARLVPVEILESEKHFMFGGNYGSTSDSRFNRAVSDVMGYDMMIDIVKIFDRVE